MTGLSPHIAETLTVLLAEAPTGYYRHGVGLGLLDPDVTEILRDRPAFGAAEFAISQAAPVSCPGATLALPPGWPPVEGGASRADAGVLLHGEAKPLEVNDAKLRRYHPDAKLLDICARLREQAVEWQRLYDLTSDDPEVSTPADLAWEAYSRDVWPGQPASWDRPPEPDDLVGQLRVLRATTPEGCRAKAAAIISHEETGHYTGDTRNDAIEIMMSLLEDVAQGTELRIGADRKVKRW